MTSLARVMSIIHFKIALPMRWLAGNTHLVHGLGYDWSIHSMGKAIDALHDTMVIIAGDGKKFLDETFMNNIFPRLARTRTDVHALCSHAWTRCISTWMSLHEFVFVVPRAH